MMSDQMLHKNLANITQNLLHYSLDFSSHLVTKLFTSAVMCDSTSVV